MKRFLVLFAVMALCAGVANAQFIYEHNNEIGIYTSPNPTAENAEALSCYQGGPGQFTAYIVITNPYNENTGNPISALGGFEFRVVLPAGVFFTPALPPATTNFASAPDFLCGTNLPIVDSHATVITATLGTFSASPWFIYLTPVQNAPQSVPGEMAVTDLNDSFSISRAYPVSGSHDAPVFGFMTCVVPAEDASWGEVKSLFR